MLHLKPLDLVQLNSTDTRFVWEQLSQFMEGDNFLGFLEIFLLCRFCLLYIDVLFIGARSYI